MDHVKPTQEELDQGAEKALQEAEAIKLAEETKEKEKAEEVKEKVKEIETPEEEVEEVEDVEEEEPEVETEVEPEETPKEEEIEPEPSEEEETQREKELKERQKKSTQEAQVLHARDKKLFETLESIDEVPEPTEEELTKEFPDFEIMTEFEKRQARNDIVYGKKFAALDKMRKDFKDVDVWQGKIDTFIQDPKNLTKFPKIDGRTDEFKIFASKPSRRGVDFEDLIPAFLYANETARPKHKGKMFETGQGDSKPTKPKSNKLSIEDARELRKTDYNKFKKLLIAGKIESEF